MRHLELTKVLLSLCLTLLLSTFVIKTQYHLVDWINVLFVTAGLYFFLGLIAELLFKLNQKQQEVHKEILHNEILHQASNPCLLISLDDLQILEVNQSTRKRLTLNEHHIITSLFDVTSDESNGELKGWLEGLKTRPKYSSFMLHVNVKDRHGKLVPKLSKLTFFPYDINDTNLGIIKVAITSKVLGSENYSNGVKNDINVTRQAAGAAYWELDLASRLLYYSDSVGDLLGLDHTFSSPILIEDLDKKADCAIFKFVEKSFTEGSADSFLNAQKMIIDRSGNQIFVVVQSQYFEKENVILGTLYDMTSVKKTEIKLRQREQQMNQLIDSIPEGIMVLQKSKVVFLNRAAVKLFNFVYGEQTKDMMISNFVSDNDKSLLRDRIKYMLAGKKRSYGFTNFKLKKYTGEHFEAEVAVNLIIYDGIESIQFVIRDLTDVLRVKNALAKANNRLSALSSKTLQLIETERKQIAGELHDDVGQSLTAILLATKWVSRRITDEALLEKVSDIHMIASQSLDTVRNLSLLLRPAQLDSLGFSPAIKWQMDKLLSIDGVHYEIDDSGFNELIDKQAEIVGFRIVQESLTNIVKHADAKNVKVKLRSDDEVLVLQISDDGRGFDVHAQSDSVGLVNMKERVELAGGEFKILSKPFLGTDIKVQIPLRNTFTSLDSKEGYQGELL
ncbi:PAS domain-containing sensor histidine kinase [Psychrosphaera aestuarii]|uniref:PAS domain-containing sensor histidine kinase n=1 Tax=Psychrosphaera aestuarii TaxID=1266052 RepID=UPI001B32C666|nr:PAS domain-containing sensor histidine kinase [Psychrosphaera aestuarii]